MTSAVVYANPYAAFIRALPFIDSYNVVAGNVWAGVRYVVVKYHSYFNAVAESEAVTRNIIYKFDSLALKF